MIETCALVIDGGSKFVKTLVISEAGRVLSSAKAPWIFRYPTELSPYGVDFDPARMWKTVVESVRTALSPLDRSKLKILGVSATSQRHGIVLLDQDGSILYAGPNSDARGLLVQDAVEELVGEKLYERTGHRPAFLFSPARLLWLKENDSARFKKIAHFLTIDGWLENMLGGEFVVDPSAAGETQLFEISSRSWAKDIIEALGLSQSILPQVSSFSKQVGRLKADTAMELGLSEDLPIVLSGADTQCALIGCSAKHDYNAGAVLGTTGPVQMVVPSPIIDGKKRVWTGCFPTNGKWVLESNAGPLGMIQDWVLDVFSGGASASYSSLDSLAIQAQPGSKDTYALLGPRIMNAERFIELTRSLFVLPPIIPRLGSTPLVSDFIRSSMEAVAFAIRGNFEQLEDASGRRIEKVFVCGGLSVSRLLVQMLCDTMGRDVFAPRVRDASAMGCALAVMKALQVYSSLDEAIEAMVRLDVFHPDASVHTLYQGYYSRWMELQEKVSHLE